LPERERESRCPCKAHPFNLSAHRQDGLFYLRIGGDFERASVGHVQSALAGLRSDHPRRVVFDLSGVTFLDSAALTTILRADRRARSEGFDVVVVRPRSRAGRLFSLSRVRKHMTVVNHPREAVADPVGSQARPAAAIEFRRLALEDVSTCVRCHSNLAVWDAGQVIDGPVTLVSRAGPICRGCITKEERIELGEAILAKLRLGQPQNEAKLRAFEEALAELRDSRRAD